MDFQEKQPPQQFADGIIEKAVQHRYLICRGLACLTLPFRRYGGGCEVEGRILALGMLAGWSFFTHDIFCLLYSGGWLAGMILYSATTRRENHSRWDGWPYLMWLIPSYRVANFLEIFAVAGIGCVVPAPFLGMILLASAAGMWINFITDWWERLKEVRAYHDSAIEMRNRREAYKRGW